MARSQVASLKSRINKVNRAIEKAKLKKAKKAEKEKLVRELDSKRKALTKMK